MLTMIIFSFCSFVFINHTICSKTKNTAPVVLGFLGHRALLHLLMVPVSKIRYLKGELNNILLQKQRETVQLATNNESSNGPGTNYELTGAPADPSSPESPRSPLSPGEPEFPGEPGLPAVPGLPYKQTNKQERTIK